MTGTISTLTRFSEDVPANLPPPEQIVALCKEAGYNRHGIPFIGPFGAVLAWFKYGPHVTLDEAFTQVWVARHLNAKPEDGVKVPQVFMAFTSPHPACTIGFIIMEYIAAPDCTSGDYERVAQAVNTLIRIKAPNSVPGPIGGGAVVHSFFPEWTSGIRYKTSKELQSHLNQILKINKDNKRVSFEAEGLYLCPVDINPGHFKKLEDGRIVVLDFRATCFLPESFIAYAMQKPVHKFKQMVAKYVNYPASNNVEAMAVASGYLVYYGRSNIGLPTNVLRRMRR
ncbi:uncharacterized protein EI90DRAFT_2999968 [Cantharellus anzutake]|uniref:uncharacterized protein n=1 Tax=Cantharellus anzutake TaxID=1750568 RepID=UPI00190638C4|nr:uncharacterized protein EI90DRAFT_2999968 [Cantharellus anzutake]KAF8325328.1 hypothetical protein EI90DRAFT_2999968 [Cantharellus anzutake]